MGGGGGGGGGGGSDVFICQSILGPADIWQCLCPCISWPALLTMCPSTLWLTHLTVCWSISWQYCYVLLLTVFVQPSHILQTHLTNVFISWPADAFNSVFFYLMTCRHFWQCLCSSISWPADTFNSVCVHPSHDLRHFWQCLCPSISWPQTLLTVFVSIHLMTCRHFLNFLCPSMLWPADIFDSGPSISWQSDTF